MADLQGPSSTPVEGPDAHDATATENPVVVGGTAQADDDTAPPNQVGAEGDVTRLAMNSDGAVYTLTHPPRSWHVTARYTTAQTDTSVKAAPGAGLSLHITDIYCSAGASTIITLEEGSTRLFEYEAGGAGDGVSLNLGGRIKLTANTALTITTLGTVDINITVCGYTAP